MPTLSMKCKRRRLMVPLFIAALAAAALFCTLPEDATQNPENVTLTVIRTLERSDSVTIGDSLRLQIAVQYPYLVDSVKVKVGEFYTTKLIHISDTMSVTLLPITPGRFAVEITGYCIRDVVVRAAATVFVGSIPIVVAQEPVDDTVVEGGSALFTVAATGNPLPVVQWFSDTVPVGGATGDTLHIDTARVASSGSGYHARLTNGFDTLWSRKAILIVNAAVYRWDAMRWGAAVWR